MSNACSGGGAGVGGVVGPRGTGVCKWTDLDKILRYARYGSGRVGYWVSRVGYGEDALEALHLGQHCGQRLGFGSEQ